MFRNGEEAQHFAIIESLGGGVALIDYDGDGLLDLFLTGGGYYDGKDKRDIKGHGCRLYKNLGKGKFRDVTREVGLDPGAPGLFYTHGCAVGDYNRDGWPDLLVTGCGLIRAIRSRTARSARVWAWSSPIWTATANRTSTWPTIQWTIFCT